MEPLAQCAEHTELCISPIIYAEVSVGFFTIEALDAAEQEFSTENKLCSRQRFPCWQVLPLSYRKRGSNRMSPLPDFYISAHAAVGNLAVLTRDASRYRTYFPTLVVLSPA